MRAVLVIIGLSTWYNLTFLLLPDRRRKRLRWLGICLYTLAAFTSIWMVSSPQAFINKAGNPLIWRSLWLFVFVSPASRFRTAIDRDRTANKRHICPDGLAP